MQRWVLLTLFWQIRNLRLGKIDLKASEFTWLSVQQSWNVMQAVWGQSPWSLPWGISTRLLVTTCVSHLTAASGPWSNFSALVSSALFWDKVTGGRWPHQGMKKHHFPNIRCRQWVFHLWLVYSSLPWEKKMRVLSSKSQASLKRLPCTAARRTASSVIMSPSRRLS